MRFMRIRDRFRVSESGSVAIEFGIVGLLVIVLCIGTVEFGRALYLANELSYAADRGTRLVLLNPAVSDTDVKAEVRANLRLANTDGLEISISRNIVDSVTIRSLNVSLPLKLLIPAFSLAELRLTTERKVPIP